jgi:bifunctional non-homologous end joining protein LigD
VTSGIAVKRGGEVTLFSRHQKVLNGRFPGVVDALASLKGDFVLDGELVAFDSQGRPSFQILQDVSSNRIPISFYAFDLLNRNGELLVCLPLSERRKTLETYLPGRQMHCAYHHCLRRHPDKFSRRCASTAWKAS